MATLRKLLFFFLTLVILGAGGYAQDEYLEQLLRRAQQGEASAQWQLGIMYYGGLGVPKDYQEAVKWFRKAADQGFDDAQYNLGVMYAHGEGVPKDYVLAHVWINLAVANSTEEDVSELGVKRRDELEENMTPEQIAEAHRLSREWKPKGKNE